MYGDDMKTRIYNIQQDDSQIIITDAASTLQQGGLVVFPTETVYGIGANALDPKAASNIYRVKGRPSDNPLIVHIADAKDVIKYAEVRSADVDLLIQAFWPGPFTLILPKKDCIPKAITGGLETVAIRFPDNDIAQAIINASNLPICAPSANRSGTPSSTLFQHVFDDFNGKVDIIIDGGPSFVGLESTVLDMTGPMPTILRPGYVTKTMIEEVLGYSILSQQPLIEDDDTPKSPGMKYKHYAPKGDVLLLDGTQDQIIQYLANLPNENVGVIGSSELLANVHQSIQFDLGSLTDPVTIAKRVFLALRSMDEQNVKTIYIEALEESDLGEAIMNRLYKAANYNIIHL